MMLDGLPPDDDYPKENISLDSEEKIENYKGTDKEVRTLCRNLGERFGRHIIVEEAIKNDLIKDSKHYLQVAQPRLIRYNEINRQMNNKNKLSDILSSYEGYEYANFYFLERKNPSKSIITKVYSDFFVTPMAILRQKEYDRLTNFSYNYDDKDVHEAMRSLNIDNHYYNYLAYIDPVVTEITQNPLLSELVSFFERYKQIYDNKNSIRISNSYKKKINQILINYGINDKVHFNFHLDDLIFKISGIISNSSLYKAGESFYDKMPEYFKDKDLEFNRVNMKIFREKGLEKFHKFVFTLPDQDKNLSFNSYLLKHGYIIKAEFYPIIKKEYLSGKNFHQYFNSLSDEMQLKTIEKLSEINLDNHYNNIPLYKKGVKGLRLDHVALCRTDPETFIEYFNAIGGEKKGVISDIINLTDIDKSVREFLEKHEKRLLQEVSFDG